METSKPTVNEVLIGLSGRQKQVKIDSKKVSSKAKYGFLGSSVCFVPDDLYLVKGSPDTRRSYIDDLTVNLDTSAFRYFSQFQKTLKQRNRVLKKIKEGVRDYEQLDLWTDQFVSSAVDVYQQRQSVVGRLNRVLPEIYGRLFGVEERLSVNHLSNLDDADDFREGLGLKLRRLREAECAVGYSLAGPHRDDFSFLIDELPAKSFASQGQTRSIVIALKIAQLELTREARKWSPILLLDDIISELDEQRVGALVEYLANYPGQLFVTTAEYNKLKTLHDRFSQFELIDLMKPENSPNLRLFQQS